MMYRYLQSIRESTISLKSAVPLYFKEFDEFSKRISTRFAGDRGELKDPNSRQISRFIGVLCSEICVPEPGDGLEGAWMGSGCRKISL
jgi:hypothetical protein